MTFYHQAVEFVLLHFVVPLVNCQMDALKLVSKIVVGFVLLAASILDAGVDVARCDVGCAQGEHRVFEPN